MTPEELNKLRFETALANRNLEIDLVWKRSQFFWLLSGVALIAYSSLKSDSQESLRLIISCYGLVSSFCWMLINIGSKWWQEAWEAKLKAEESYIGLNFFDNYKPASSRIFLFPLVRFSVTGIAVAFSFFLFLVWLGLATWEIKGNISITKSLHLVIDLRNLGFYIFAVISCVVIYFGTRGRQK